MYYNQRKFVHFVDRIRKEVSRFQIQFVEIILPVIVTTSPLELF